MKGIILYVHNNTGELHALFSSGDGVVAIDDEQRIIYWNAAAEEILGYAAADLIGEPCFRLFASHTPQHTLCCCQHCHIVRQVQLEKPIPSFQAIVKHKDGRPLLLDFSTLFPTPNNKANQLPFLIHLFRSQGEPLTHNPGLRIHLLGSTRVWRADGTDVQGRLWRQTKVRALLAYLAINKGHPIHQETLLERLWPEMNSKTGRHNLYTTVHNLRRTLEPDLQRTTDSRYILQENNAYLLDPNLDHWLDVTVFKTLLRQARQETDVKQSISLHERAADLYQGDFLADLGNTIAWHWREQERLRELYLDALEELGRLYEVAQQENLAMAHYQKLLSLDPCREKACQALMQLHLRHGDRAAALARYQQLVKDLASELNVAPGEQIHALYQTILQNY